MKAKYNENCAALFLNYNHSDFLKNSLGSIINQSIPFDEIIIIDDCSTDNSVEVIKKLIVNKKKITLITNKINKGVVENLNAGVKLLKSHYIYFVSADDHYNDNIAKAFKETIVLYPNIAMISGNVSRKRPSMERPENLILPFKTLNNLCDPTIYMNTAQQRVVTFFGGGNIIKKDIIDSLNGFEPSLKWSADWFLYQLIGFSETVYIKNEFFMTINITNDSFSQKSLDWNNQKVIIINFLNILIDKHPRFFKSFKDASILPFYDIRILFIILRNKSYIKIITPLLIWRLISYNIFKKLNNITPTKWHLFIRKLIKV